MNKPKRKFGENKEATLRAEILDTNGKLEVVVFDNVWPTLIRNEYLPVGRVFVFPKKWGRKKGAEILVKHHIEQQERIIQKAKDYLEDLSRMLSGLEGWDGGEDM